MAAERTPYHPPASPPRRSPPLPIDVYGADTLARLVDLYELTMACAYWRAGRAEDEAVFHLFFRQAPHGGAFAIAAGVAQVARYLERWRFDAATTAALGALRGGDGEPLFDRAFLDRLLALEPALAIDAVAEGEVVFPLEPLLRVEGPLWQCQLLETALLNLVNFPTLIATKAARVAHLAAAGAPVIEFGLRRSPGIDGGLTASWASYLGGCAATSNVMAGLLLGLPLRGTHAHSWVLAFEGEQDAHAAWLRAMPGNATLLVDTNATELGIERAIAAARESERGTLDGVRLDSGDLLGLAVLARQRLDEAGLRGAQVVASGDLDEEQIAALRAAGAPIDAWGVGTRLVTGNGDPALTGVYKLSAIRRPGERRYRHTAKRSDDRGKATLGGRLQVQRREGQDGAILGDLLYDLDAGRAPAVGGSPGERSRAGGRRDLLWPLVRGRSLARPAEPAAQVRERVAHAVARLPPGVRRLRDPTPFVVAIDSGVSAVR